MAAAKPRPSASFTVPSKSLADALSSLVPIAAKESIPVLKTALIEVADSQLAVSASDMDTQLTVRLEAEISAPWRGCLDLRLLDQWVRAAEESLTFAVDGGAHVVLNDDSGTCARLLYRDAKDFPTAMAVEGEDVAVDGATLKGLLEVAVAAVVDAESRYALNGVWLRCEGGQIEAVGTDGMRIVRAIAKTDAAIKSVIIPRKAVAVLLKILGDGDVAIRQSDNLLSLTSGASSFVTRKLDGQYPDVEAMGFFNVPDAGVTLTVSVLISALERLLPLRDERRYWGKWTVGDGKLRIETIAADIGEASVEIACDYSGNPCVFGLDSKLTLPVLKRISAETVRLCFTTGEKGIYFAAENVTFVQWPIQPHLL